MTITNNIRELSKKRKVASLTIRAWIYYAGLVFLSLIFATDSKSMLTLSIINLFFYIGLFIAERIDEDIFEILTINFFQQLGGDKFHA